MSDIIEYPKIEYPEFFYPSPEDFDDDEVIFAGFDSSPYAKDCRFGIYVPLNDDEAVWLPAVTSSIAVKEQLRGLRLGEVFKITAEETEGGMGTRVNAVEVDGSRFGYRVPAGRPPSLKI